VLAQKRVLGLELLGRRVDVAVTRAQGPSHFFAREEARKRHLGFEDFARRRHGS
jgi:hypothetical protein